MSPFAPRPDQLKTAPRVFTLVIPALCLAYLSVMTALGGPHPEHWLAAGIALLLALWSDHTRQLARVGLPFVLYAVIYDSMRWYEDYIRSPVIHVHELSQIGHGGIVTVVSFIALAIASINVFGGFTVTQRMLTMFRKG